MTKEKIISRIKGRYDRWNNIITSLEEDGHKPGIELFMVRDELEDLYESITGKEL